jgi:O-acetyl-ADP-ribose deacetylase (regulator of RNase III)
MESRIERDKELRVNRHLIIGLGGTGHHILMDLRRRIAERYGNADALSWVRLLSIDTEAHAADDLAAEPALRLTGFISVHTPLDYRQVDSLSREPKRFSHLTEWLDERALREYISQGLWQARSLGRLAFFQHHQTISQKLSEAISHLTSLKAGHASLFGQRIRFNPDIIIIIVGSLSEVTCGGMFLDLAYVVREQLLFRRLKPTDVVGMFLVSPVPVAQESRAGANSYSAMTELNHYFLSETEFFAAYDQFSSAICTQAPPFDRFYLLEDDSESNAAPLAPRLQTLVSERLFLEITSECGAVIRAAQRNLPLKSPDSLGRPSGYCSFGMSSLSVPASKMIGACASRLAQAAVRRWTGRRLENAQTSGRITSEELLSKGGLDIRAIREGLREAKGSLTQTFENELSRRCQEVQLNALKITETETLGYLKSAKEKMAGWVQEITVNSIEDNARQLVQRGAESLRGMVRSHLISSSQRHEGAIGFLSELRQSFQLCIDALQKEIDELEDGLAVAARQLQEALAAKQPDEGFIELLKARRRRAAIANFAAAAQDYFRAVYDRTINSCALRCYKDFIAQADAFETQSARAQALLDNVDSRLKKFEEAVLDRNEIETGRNPLSVQMIESLYRQQMERRADELIDREARKRISLGDDLEGLLNIGSDKIYKALLSTAQEYLSGLNNLSSLPLFLEQEESDEALAHLQQMGREARPLMRFNEALAPDGIFRQFFVSVPDARQHQSYIEQSLREAEVISHPTDVHWIDTSDPYQTSMLLEYVGFPLEALSALDAYEAAYNETAQSSQFLLYTRKDVEWNPIKVKKPGDAQRQRQEIRSVSDLRVADGMLKVTTDSLVGLDVDAIICFRNRSMKDDRAVERSGYSAIQHGGVEIDEGVALYKTLALASFCVTTGGRLRAAYLVHLAVVDDIDAEATTEIVLREALRAALEECEGRDWSSVAIPLPAQGIGGLSRENCVRIIFDEAHEYLERSAFVLQLMVLAASVSETLAEIVTLITERRSRIGVGATAAHSSAPAEEEPIEYSQRFLYAMEHKFPYRISRALYELRGIDGSMEETTQLTKVMGLTLEHLSMMALAEYLSGERRDPVLNRRLLETFKKPVTYGKWAEVLRDLLTFIRECQPEEGVFVPELPSLYFPTRDTPKAARLQLLIDKTVAVRNTIYKKNSDSLTTPVQHRLYKRLMMELLQNLAFLKDYPIVSEKNSHTEKEIKTHTCNLHMGFHDAFSQIEVQCDLDLEKAYVAMLKPNDNGLLYLYPFCVLRECPEKNCHLVHLFSFNKIENQKIEFIGARDHILRDAQAYDDLKAMLEVPSRLKLRHRSNYLSLFYNSFGTWSKIPTGRIIKHKYQVIEHLRRGGMADVYRVQDLDSDRQFALKLLPFQFISNEIIVSRFRQEAKQAIALNHQNITRIVDYGEELADHYLVMELATGWKLEDGKIALDVGELPNPINEEETTSIIKQICESLIYIHDKGIVHRDIKPGNMLLFEGGTVKLADFGIARSRESMTLTITGLPIGTPEYMSPEQAEGKKGLSAVTDIYSLGVVIYKLLTGEVPFKRDRPFATALAHLYDSVPSPQLLQPQLSDNMQSVVMKCLDKNPAKRFQSARELLKSLP